jgi:transcriptional regulator with PAS, ATPase and Fis domain
MLPIALSLLETMPGGAILCDAGGALVGINGTCRRMFRVRVREVVGNPITDLCPDSQWQAIVRTGLPSGAGRITVNGEQVVRVELPVFADGRVVAVLAHFFSKDTGLLREILLKLPGLEGQGAPQAQVSRVTSIDETVLVGGARYTFDDIHCGSRAMREVKALAARAARTDMPLLIQGEQGTEILPLAHAIHAASSRAQREIVLAHCRTPSDAVLAAELFGPPGFGNAAMGMRGRLLDADGSTLLLQDVDQMPLAVQSRLVRVMQAGEVEYAGNGHPTKINIRVIAGCYGDLAAKVAAGEFREDLYYRLNVIRLDIPPLRARPEDTRILADHRLGELNRVYADRGWHKRLSQEALELLLRYGWPGNTAELDAVLERAFAMSEGDEIHAEYLPQALQQIGRAPSDAMGQKTLDEIVAEVERGVIVQALKATGRNKSRTARLLGLPRSSFYEKLARYGLMSKDD